MKWNVSGFRTRWSYPVRFALGAMPLALLAHRLWVPSEPWLCVIFPVMYVLTSLFCILAGGKRRLLWGILSAALIGFAALVFCPWQEIWQTLLVPAGCIVFLFLTLPMAGWDFEREPPVAIWFILIFIHMFGQVVCFFDMKDLYTPAEPAMLWCFLGFGALHLLALNRESLISGAAKGRQAPVGMQRKNRLMTAALMALIVIVSAIPAIAEFLAMAWEWFKQLVLAFLRFLDSLLPDQQPVTGTGGGSGDGMMMFGDPSAPSPVALFLEKVAIVAAILIGAVLLFFAFRFLGRRLRILMKHLWALMNRYAHAASEDYVDEIADTRETGEDTSTGPRQLFRRVFQQVNEDKLGPTERIRYRYSRLMNRHQDWQPGSTARENLAEDAAGIYERARYSTQSVSPEEAEQFAQYSKSLEKNPTHN